MVGYKDASQMLLEISKLLQKLRLEGTGCRCKFCHVSIDVCPVIGQVGDIIANESE